MKAAVIGHPIAHSKSPIIHQHWIEKYNIAGRYEAIDVPPDTLDEKVREIVDDGFDGFNVTVPHKESIFSLCDEIDGMAQQIGAVNTIIIKNKKLIGMNTDAFGFIENLKSGMPDLSSKKVLLLGAGGAAKALIYSLFSEGVAEIVIANRTLEKAEKLQELAPDKIRVVTWDEKESVLPEIDLLVNGTSLGMTGKPPLEIDLSGLNKSTAVNDIVYAPIMTELLKQAQNQGHKIVTGIGMLLHQARPAFEAWTGIMPEVDDDLLQKVLS